MRSQTLCIPRKLFDAELACAGLGRIADVVPIQIGSFPAGAFAFISRTIVDESDLKNPNTKLAQDFHQVMPYIVVHSKEKGYLTYSRDTTAGEQRLLGSRSLGFGGHATLADLDMDDIHEGETSKTVFNVLQTLTNTAERELREELLGGLDSTYNKHIKLFRNRLRFSDYMIYDNTPSTEEDQLAQGLAHVGVIVHYDVTGLEKDISETVEAQRLEWHKEPESLFEALGEFESWSQLLILEYLMTEKTCD